MPDRPTTLTLVPIILRLYPHSPSEPAGPLSHPAGVSVAAGAGLPPAERPPTMLPSTDEALMERVQEGNIQAFDALYERYSARIHAFLLRRTGDREGAAELHQDTFLRIWRHRASYRSGSPFRPWMYGIAANAARDRLRAQARRPEQLMALPPEHPAAPPSGDERDLEAAIFALPDNLREAFLLGAIEGLDHNQVAEALGIRPDNARARISRARASLRKALGVDT